MQNRAAIRGGRVRARTPAFENPDQLKVEARNFRRYKSNTLQGFFDAFLPALGLTIRGTSLHQRDGRWWVSPPGRPHLKPDGTQARDRDGRPRFSSVFEFSDRGAQDRFSEAAVGALKASQPDAFLEGGDCMERALAAATDKIDGIGTSMPRRRAKRRRVAAPYSGEQS